MVIEYDFAGDTIFQGHWAYMGNLAFSQQKKAGPGFKSIYGLLRDEQHKQHWPILQVVHDWLLVPYSFWAVDMIGVSNFMIKEICAGRPFSRKFALLIRFLSWYPPKLAQELIALHEHSVSKGQYDKWVRLNKKFEAYEKKVLTSRLLQKEWQAIKDEFPVAEYANKDGVVRRHVACERNFKDGDWAFHFGEGDDEDEFYTVFTGFCAKWKLWGMAFDKPLLLKLSVNMTPFCLLVGIPFYMNINGKNDIVWREVSKVLKALGAVQAGIKRLEAQVEREDEALRTLDAETSAQAKELKGQDRIDHIIEEACLPLNVDARGIRTRLALGRKLRQQAAG